MRVNKSIRQSLSKTKRNDRIIQNTTFVSKNTPNITKSTKSQQRKEKFR